MPINGGVKELQSTFSNSLRKCIDYNIQTLSPGLTGILEYQLGWQGVGSGSGTMGKQLRPVLLLLVCDTLGGEWKQALPAAVAIELIHNFSLVHDDIQDRSLTRRGRDTVWVKWGEAQAINAGDALLALANLELLNISNYYPTEIVVRVGKLIQETCVELTRGQYLDLFYEAEDSIPINAYWQMIEGKTGALIGACFGIGAILAGIKEEDLGRFISMGRKIGVAFQVQDDYLGIWGDERITGKSSSSDLLEKKKTFPVLMALSKSSEFRERWRNIKIIDARTVYELVEYLEKAGVQETTRKMEKKLFYEVRSEMKELFKDIPNDQSLFQTVWGLFDRVN